MTITCDKCGSQNITYYKQERSDGVIVVTARCDKMHIPNKYKPFYPVYNFHLDKLEFLPRPLIQMTWSEYLNEHGND